MSHGVFADDQGRDLLMDDPHHLDTGFTIVAVENLAHQSVIGVDTRDDRIARWNCIGRARKWFRQRYLNGDGFDFIDFHENFSPAVLCILPSLRPPAIAFPVSFA